MLKKYASLKNIKILLVISLVVHLFIFPILIYFMKAEHMILDLRFSYNESDVKLLFKELTEHNTLTLYKYTILLVDIIYPIIYTLLLMFIIEYLVKKNGIKNFIKFIVFLPIPILFFDYLENYNTLNMMNSYLNNPNFHDHQAFFGSNFSSCKWIFVMINFTLIAVLFIIPKTKKSSQKI